MYIKHRILAIFMDQAMSSVELLRLMVSPNFFSEGGGQMWTWQAKDVNTTLTLAWE